jgi:hypothetical protein
MRPLPHACTVDSQLFTKHRNFGFKLVNSGVFRITVLDQSFAAREHRDAHDADHLEHRTAHERASGQPTSAAAGVLVCAVSGCAVQATIAVHESRLRRVASFTAPVTVESSA